MEGWPEVKGVAIFESMVVGVRRGGSVGGEGGARMLGGKWKYWCGMVWVRVRAVSCGGFVRVERL